MNVLGIETSCDETSAAVVAETGDAARPWAIRSNVIASQVAIHREWGGVVPELASRQHIRDICGVVERALEDGGAAWTDLDAIAVTQGPGLVGSLLVGVAFAKAAGFARDLPVIPVHHLAGHIESLFLHNGAIPLPAAVLVVSGGHTSLYSVPAAGEYHLIGRTRDDAAGEAYDKVAKMLGLGYPGGPIVDKLAREGNDRAFDLPVTRITHRDRLAPAVTPPAGLLPRSMEFKTDFSFSGLKTAMLRQVRRLVLAGIEPRSVLTPVQIADLCASFQRVVVQTLLDRTFVAAEWLGARSIGIAGGVSANSRLRADALARGEQAGIPVFLPSLSLSTDNAAMIAAAGLRKLERGAHGSLDFNAEASLPL
jgi:tRNA N6-adenosine threonylcarbamoyltransferase